MKVFERQKLGSALSCLYWFSAVLSKSSVVLFPLVFPRLPTCVVVKPQLTLRIRPRSWSGASRESRFRIVKLFIRDRDSLVALPTNAYLSQRIFAPSAVSVKCHTAHWEPISAGVRQKFKSMCKDAGPCRTLSNLTPLIQPHLTDWASLRLPCLPVKAAGSAITVDNKKRERARDSERERERERII